jgi:amphi-Trp domain-containing protein
MTKNKLKAKGTLELKRAIGYLEDTLEGMKSGRVVVRMGDQTVTFHPVDKVEMEIGAKEKDGKQKFSMEMTWREHAHAREMAGLTISSEKSNLEGSMSEGLILEESMSP